MDRQEVGLILDCCEIVGRISPKFREKLAFGATPKDCAYDCS